MKHILLTTVTWSALTLAAFAEDKKSSDGISVEPSTGKIFVSNQLPFRFCWVSRGWRSQLELNADVPPEKGKPIEFKREIQFKGLFKVETGEFDYIQTIRPCNDGGLDCKWAVRNQQGIETEALFILLKLPASEYQGATVNLDAKAITLPPIVDKFEDIKVFSGVKRIEIPVGKNKIVISGTLAGTLMSAMGGQEGPYYGLRLNASPSTGRIIESEINFHFTESPIAIDRISLSSAAKTSLYESSTHNLKSEEKGHGCESGLASIHSGEILANGIPFFIADPLKGDKSPGIVLTGSGQSATPRKITIPMQGQVYSKLFLLHGAALAGREPAVGSISATYQDGTTDKIEVNATRDVADLAGGTPNSNATLAWSGTAEGSESVFLYTSSFSIKEKPLSSISLISYESGPVWAIEGISGLRDTVSPTHPAAINTVTYTANKDWRSIKWDPMAIVKGSALDFSGMLDAPSGIHGEVLCRDDNFYFKDAPDKPARFYGNTLLLAVPFVDKNKAEALADCIAAMGYNVIRFHCYLRWLIAEDGYPGLDPKGLDQFEYFLHCLARKGIYYTFPLFGNATTGNAIIHDAELPEYSDRKLNHEFRGIFPISRPAMVYMQNFSRNLLLHVNPYNGLAIKDDPALLSIELLNEDSVHSVLAETPSMRQVYLRKCREYLRIKNGGEASDSEVERFMPRYIILVQENATKSLIDYLRSIGLKKPITDKTAEEFLSLAPIREQLDYVDVHAYWDIAEDLPARLALNNPNVNKWSTQLTAGAARLFGKPFSQGEYNTVYPSPYWTYMGPAEAAMAGVQNWGMIIRCGIGIAPDQVFVPYPALGIKMQNPMIMLSERIGAILFSAGEVTPSKIKIPYVVTPEYIDSHTDGTGGGGNYMGSYAELGLSCQIGTVIWRHGVDLSKYPAIVVPPDMKLPKAIEGIRHYVSDSRLLENINVIVHNPGAGSFASTTGQTFLDTKKQTFKIVTPRSECFLLPSTVGILTGNMVSVSKNNNISTCFVGSLDRLPIDRSNRLLALFITDLKNTGSVVDYEKNGAVFRKIGNVPFLLKQGELVFSIKTSHVELPKIWALKYDGSRAVSVQPIKTKEGFSFTAAAVTNDETYFSFEIQW